jgi:hypothetical protein
MKNLALSSNPYEEVELEWKENVNGHIVKGVKIFNQGLKSTFCGETLVPRLTLGHEVLTLFVGGVKQFDFDPPSKTTAWELLQTYVFYKVSGATAVGGRPAHYGLAAGALKQKFPTAMFVAWFWDEATSQLLTGVFDTAGEPVYPSWPKTFRLNRYSLKPVKVCIKATGVQLIETTNEAELKQWFEQ